MNDKPIRIWTWVNRAFKLAVIILVLGVGLVAVGGYEVPGFSDVIDPDHSASPNIEGVNKVHLETDTLHVTVNNNSDYPLVYVVAPDGKTHTFYSSDEFDSDQTMNRPDGWPAGNYTVQDVGQQGTVYNTATVYLEPEK